MESDRGPALTDDERAHDADGPSDRTGTILDEPELRPIASAGHAAADSPMAGERERLVEEYAGLGESFDFIFYVAVAAALQRRLAAILWSRANGLLVCTMEAGFLFASPLAIAVASGTLDNSPVLSWLAFAAIYGFAAWSPIGDYPLWRGKGIATGRALSSTDDLRAVIGWTRRWLRLRYAAATSAFLGATFAAGVFFVSSGDWSTVPPGTIWLLLIELYFAGELVWWAAHKVAADRMVARMDFDLPAFRPVDSPLVRQFVHSANGLTLNNAGWSVVYLCLAVVILPQETGLFLPFAALILGVCYASVIADAVSTRQLVTHIIARSRMARLDDFRDQIEFLVSRVPELSPAEEHRLDLLRKTYDDVDQSPITYPLLPAAGRAFIAMLVPTLTFVALTVAEGAIERELNVILDKLGR
jgi:hypothetical protein